MAHRHVCPALISSVENQKDSRLLAIWSCYCCHFLHGPIRLLWMGLLLLLLSSCCWRLKPSPPLLLLQDDSLNNIILPHFPQHLLTRSDSQRLGLPDLLEEWADPRVDRFGDSWLSAL